MDKVLEYICREWRVLKGAPYLSAAVIIIAFLGGWQTKAFLNTNYIESLEAIKNQAEVKLDKCQSTLNENTSKQAVDCLPNMDAQNVLTGESKKTPLTYTEQKEQLSSFLSIDTTDVIKVYLEYDGSCKKCAENALTIWGAMRYVRGWKAIDKEFEGKDSIFPSGTIIQIPMDRPHIAITAKKLSIGLERIGIQHTIKTVDKAKHDDGITVIVGE
jgi:hypothetical protein